MWILAEEKQKYLISLNCVGAMLNVALNWLMIPRLNANGAAIASLLTQFFVNIVFVSIYKPTRQNGRLIFRACNPRLLVDSLRHIVGIKKG